MNPDHEPKTRLAWLIILCWWKSHNHPKWWRIGILKPAANDWGIRYRHLLCILFYFLLYLFICLLIVVIWCHAVWAAFVNLLINELCMHHGFMQKWTLLALSWQRWRPTSHTTRSITSLVSFENSNVLPLIVLVLNIKPRTLAGLDK